MTRPARRSSVTVVTSFVLLIGATITPGWAQAAASDPVSLQGAGSTFAAPLYTRWIEEYAASRPDVSIAYNVVGSGEGVRRFLSDAVDFAGSDEILTDAEAAKAGGAIMIPVMAGMIVIAYNIPGVAGEIKLPRDVCLDIFAGGIRQWDDPRIKAANPGIAFPHRDIALVARQDGSGTTAAFTRHLDATGPFLYHNPDCGTSRNTLGLIRNAGVEPHVIEYLKTPPTRKLLMQLIKRMGISVRSSLRQKGTPYEELDLGNPALSDEELLDAMMAHPILINRPIVVTPLGVKLCRPSETVLDILPFSQKGEFRKEDGELVITTDGRRP